MNNPNLPARKRKSPRTMAIGQALFVTLLWSSSWVLIKFGLEDIPAITFAGLRYALAFLCLLPFALNRRSLASVRTLTRADWLRLALLGLLYYTVTQGSQFLALAYLPAITTTLLLNFSGIAVALFGILLLAEKPGAFQWIGAAINIAGILIYFYPVDLPAGQVLGVIIVLVSVLTNALSSILGRYVNRAGNVSPLLVTVISMGIGAVILLAVGLATQGLPALSAKSWLLIVWLAVVNTALAFTLWNHSLRVLSAMEFEHHQQHHDHPDRYPGLDLPGRTHQPAGRHRPADGSPGGGPGAGAPHG